MAAATTFYRVAQVPYSYHPSSPLSVFLSRPAIPVLLLAASHLLVPVVSYHLDQPSIFGDPVPPSSFQNQVYLYLLPSAVSFPPVQLPIFVFQSRSLSSARSTGAGATFGLAPSNNTSAYLEMSSSQFQLHTSSSS